MESVSISINNEEIKQEYKFDIIKEVSILPLYVLLFMLFMASSYFTNFFLVIQQN